MTSEMIDEDEDLQSTAAHPSRPHRRSSHAATWLGLWAILALVNSIGWGLFYALAWLVTR
jgi:hypothetical protein